MIAKFQATLERELFPERLWSQITWSSLSARLPCKPSDLPGLEPWSPHWVLCFSWVSLATAPAVQSLPSPPPDHPRTICLRLDPSPSPLWFAFGHCSCSPAHRGYHENHLIRVDSILIVPLGYHSAFPPSSPWAFISGTSACFMLYIDSIFCTILSLILLL